MNDFYILLAQFFSTCLLQYFYGGFYKLNCLYYFVNQMIIRIFKHTKS